MAIITIRGYAPSPLVTDRRRGVINAALTGLDFASEQDVRAARERITKMGRVQRFTDWAFHHGDKARALDALAILYLYKCAEKAHTVPAGLQAADRAAARQTLAERLSSPGKLALQQSFQDAADDDDFEIFFTLADRYGMAGDVFMSEGREFQFSTVFAQGRTARRPYPQIFARTAITDPASATAYRRAAEAYREANLPEQATAASLAAAADAETAARIYNVFLQSRQAADAWVRAADAYTRVAQPVEAAAAGLNAGTVYYQLGNVYLKRGQLLPAKDVYQQAEAAYGKTANACRQAAAQGLVPPNQQMPYGRRAEFHTQEAKIAFWLSKCAYGPAAMARGLVADMYKADGLLDQAAKAYRSAAELHMSAGVYWHGAKAADERALIYSALADHAKAGEAWELCALIWAYSEIMGEGGGDMSDAATVNAKAAYARAGAPHREVRKYFQMDLHALARARARLLMEGAAPPQ